jgi:ankyrin repeat protein
MTEVPFALHVAAEHGRTASVHRLVAQQGCEVDAADAYGWRALHFAAANGHVTCVRALLDGGASVDPREGVDWTPLHMAGMNGRTECARELVQRGADISAVNKYGLTALHVAARSSHAECCRELSVLGAPANRLSYTGETPLHLAASNGYDAVVRILVEQCGADAAIVDEDRRSAEDAARARGEIGVADYLQAVGQHAG